MRAGSINKPGHRHGMCIMHLLESNNAAVYETFVCVCVTFVFWHELRVHVELRMCINVVLLHLLVGCL